MTNEQPRDVKSLLPALRLAIEEARVTRPAPAALKARIATSLDTPRRGAVAGPSPTISAPAQRALTGSSPTFAGTTTPGGTYVSIFVDERYVGAVQSAVDGRWAYTSSRLPAGPHTVCVQGRDTKGNPGTFSPLVRFEVQLTAAVMTSLAAPERCPITDAFLPDNLKKHVDPHAPVPLRMMAAKGLVPLEPGAMLSVLFMLRYDAESNVREQAAKTAAALADRVAAPGFRDKAVPRSVLAWFLSLYGGHEAYAELLIHNPSTPDEAVADVASSCSQRTAEVIGQQHLRLLRTDAIVRALALNPAAQGSAFEGVCDFVVRSGLFLDDVPQMKLAKLRCFAAEVAAQQGPTAEQVMGAIAEPMRPALPLRIMGMSVSEKIKLATKGSREARDVLVRDSNRLVAVAAISSPHTTIDEVLKQARNPACPEEVLRVIYGNREYLRNYAIKLALVRNSSVPQAVAMRLLGTLHEHDIKALAKDNPWAGSVRSVADLHEMALAAGGASAASAPALRAVSSPGAAPMLTVSQLQQLLVTMKGQSYFEVLGITKDATVNQVKAAYLKAARHHHPDTTPPDAPPELAKVKADLFALIGEANRTLSDPKLRENYLAELAVGGTGAKVDVEKLFLAEERFQKGQLLVKARKYVEAVTLFDDAIAHNGEEPEFYAWRGYARFLAASEPKAALPAVLSDLKHCTSKSPNVASGWYFLGFVAKATGDLEAAKRYFEKAAHLDPRHLEATRELRRWKS